MTFRPNQLTQAVRGAFALSMLFGTSIAVAQSGDTSKDNPKQLQAVQVTGSQIRSVDYEGTEPVFTITAADIKKTGLTNVGDILQNLSTSGTQTFSKAATLASNKEAGGQYVNLHNLGEQRTLVLVNGKRWMTSLAGLTDVSTIPAALIERIDVTGDGASPIYGSDAVAGIVNIILKDHYQGVELDTQVGMNQEGDGSNTMASVTFGKSNKRGSIMVNFTYNKTQPVWAKDRSWTDTTYGPNHPLDGLSATGPWGRFVDPVNGKTYVLNHSGGSVNGGGVGADSSNLADYHSGLQTADRFNTTQQMALQIPTELHSAFATGTYNFTNNFRFKGTGMFSERISDQVVGGYPLNSDSQPTYPGIPGGAAADGGLIPISGQSVYNPVGQDITTWYRRTTEVPRDTHTDAKSYHFDGSLEGEFQVGQHDWHWDAGFNYNKWNAQSSQTGNLYLPALQKALGPSFINGQGIAQCGTAANPIALGTNYGAGQCTPFNILGGPSASSPAALQYVMAFEHSQQTSVVKQYTANIGGGLFNLPAGEVQFAAGYEHREVSGSDQPDAVSTAGYTTDLAANPTTGKYHTNEVYGEINIPILADLPFAKSLSVDAQSRYSNYSAGIGSTVRSKYQLKWQPFADLMIRGNYSQGFRAPTIADLAGGGSQSFDYYTDPCDIKFGNTGDPRVAAACHAAGVPAGFQQVDAAGKAVTGPNTQGNTPFELGVGNANLKPETTTSRSLGFVYSPHFVEGLNINVDYYDIHIDNEISAVGANFVLDQCYQQQSQAYCDRITRDPTTHQVTNVQEGNANLGWTKTSGYEFGFTYTLPEFSIGRFQWVLDANYLQSYKSQASSDSDVISSVGQWNFPRFRGTLGLNWMKGNWSALWQARYYGSFRDQCWSNPGTECSNPDYNNGSWASNPGYNHKGAIVYQDASVSWQTPWKGTIGFGIRNLFNRKPPITYSVSNSSAAYYDPTLDLDRYFFFQYSQKF